MIWEVSVVRWAFPEQDTYTGEQFTNILRTASLNREPTHDGTAPSMVMPVLLMVAGAYASGVGDTKRRIAKSIT